MKSNIENKDWLNDYPSLKQVNQANPFTVPEGYFDNLQDCIASLKTIDEFKSEMHKAGFSVPENYFNNLQETIQSRIFLENHIDKNNSGYTVPDGFFETAAKQISRRVLVEDTPLLQQEAFTVPENYFENLTNEILNKTVKNTEVVRKTIVRRLFASTAFKYATAACFAIAIGGGILLNKLTNPVYVHNHSFLHKELSSVSVDEIKNYLEVDVDAGETQHTVLANGDVVDHEKLNEALQDYADSLQ